MKGLSIFIILFSCRYSSQSILINAITDYFNVYERTEMITEYSCDKKGSFKLFKNLMTNYHQVKVLEIDVENVHYPNPNNQMFMLNLDCEYIEKCLDKANSIRMFSSPFKWLFYKSVALQNLDVFENVDMLVDSDITMMTLHENNTVFVDKIYKRHIKYPFVQENLGYWNLNLGFINSGIDKNIVRRRNDLMGIQLRASIVITHNDSLKHLTDKRDKHIDSIAKVNYVLVQHLSDIVNVTIKYSVQPTWGYLDKDSQWSGMMGELTRKEADIGGTALFFTIERVDIIDYIAMTTPTRSKFVFREPKLSYVTNVFTLPFDDRVWISTICLVILATAVLYLILKWEWHTVKHGKYQYTPTVPGLKDSVTDAALLSFGAFCQQGAPAIPFSVPGRITTIMLFVSLMFLYNSYSANIVALLQSSSTSIQTLEDLLSSRLQVGVDDTVFNRFYFPNASEKTRRAIYIQKVAPPGKKEQFMSIEEGVKKMRQGLFAFHMETGPGYKLVGEIFHENEKCGLKEIQYLQVVDPWLAVQKNTSYKELLKVGLRKIHESGLQAREVGLIYSKKPVCISRGSSFISVGIVDCYPAAVVLAAGIIISFGIFVVEIIKYKIENVYSELRSRKDDSYKTRLQYRK